MTPTEQLIENVCKAIGDLDRQLTKDQLKPYTEIEGCSDPEEYTSLYIRLLSLYDNSEVNEALATCKCLTCFKDITERDDLNYGATQEPVCNRCFEKY
jgi:hypothetical protein